MGNKWVQAGGVVTSGQGREGSGVQSEWVVGMLQVSVRNIQLPAAAGCARHSSHLFPAVLRELLNKLLSFFFCSHSYFILL